MDRSSFLKKAKQAQVKAGGATLKLDPMEIALNTKKLEATIAELQKTLGLGIDFNNIDELLDQLGEVANLSKETSELKEAINNLNIPELPDSIKVDGLADFIKALHTIKIAPPQVNMNNESVAKAIVLISDKIEKLAKAVKDNAPKLNQGQTVDDFIPTRRVIKVGNSLQFDDMPGGEGSPRLGASSGARVPTVLSSNNATLTAVPVANADGTPISAGGGAGGGASTIADGADVAQGAKADAAWVSGNGTVISLLKKIASAGGSAVSVADGSDVAQGAVADAAYVSGSGSVISVLKGIFAKLAGTLTIGGTVTVSNPTTNPETGLAKDTSIGSLTETAPATDTASSGLNGRLQRIAQRLTSLITLLPTALGQTTMSASLPVVLPSDQSTVPVGAQASTRPAATTMQNAAVANGNGVSLAVTGQAVALLNVVSSPAMSGGTTINFEASVDDTTWVSIGAHTIGVNGSMASTATADGDYRIATAGYKSIRARISAYSAGTITVKGYAVPIPSHPTAVALATGTNPIGFVGSSPNAINVNQQTVNTTAVQLSASAIVPTNGILVQALSTNAASIFVGGSGVTTSNGWELQPGQAIAFTCTLSTVYIISAASTTDKVCYQVL